MSSLKPTLVFCAPILTRSGYGEHSRDLLQSLIEMDKFDISVISINWGETPMNALNLDNPIHQKMNSLIRIDPLSEQPDIWMQCTIPNEFQAVGKFNIGITAGIETDICAGEWIDGCNKMNLIIVPSKHAKDVFLNTQYDKVDKATNQVIDHIKVNVPVEILHEGVRTDVFNRLAEKDESLSTILSENIKEDFAFLFVGHWLKGDFGQDRKDLSGLIHTFIKSFENVPNPPALILKASSGTFSVTDRSITLNKIAMIRQLSGSDISKQPKIYLLHGDLTEQELNTLYNHEKIKALVSFTKGEGYGRPIAEFITTGKPVIVSGWSGHVDFVNPAFHVYLDGQLTPVHPSAIWQGVINEGSSWFSVNYQQAAVKLREIHKNYNKFFGNSKKATDSFVTKWSFDSMTKKFDEILTSTLPTFAKKMAISLPQLKKKQDSTLTAQ